jgi:uncharacterized protein YukE
MGATDWSLIGGNPAPGDVTSLDGAAGAASTVRGEAANHLAQIQGLLSGWTGSGWSGAAADRFEELLQGIGQHLSQMEAAHDPIGRALARHAATLLQQQLAADQALQRAVSAAAQEASASARRTAASEEHAQHAETYSQAASDLSRIGDAINQRLQQLASAGIQLLGDLTHIADSALQALLGEKQVAEAAQAAAQEGMRIASGIIGEMDALIADATADLRGAIRLADEVRNEVESSVQTAERTFGDVDNDLRDLWRHVEQGVVQNGGMAIAAASTLVGRFDAALPEVEASVAASAEAVSSKVGWVVEPFIDKLGGDFSAGVEEADGSFRLGEDLFDGHYQKAFQQVSDIASGQAFGDVAKVTEGVGAKAGAEVALVGANIIIWTDVEKAAKNVKWSYTMSHLSELNPLQPGGFKVIGGAAEQGVEEVGSQLGKALFGVGVDFQ